MGDAVQFRILVADDDADDRMLIEEAFDESETGNEIEFVKDGEELLEYLRCEGAFKDRSPERDPGIILLDLNMPRKDGRVALKEIKEDPKLRQIPVIVLTTSGADEDIVQTYQLGVSSFITKPKSFEELLNLVTVLTSYWMETVALPPRPANAKE